MLVDADLAAWRAPILCFDRNEPFLPSRAGFTLLREAAFWPTPGSIPMEETQYA